MNPEFFNKLSGKFPPKEYALLKEVRDAAGHYANRSIDALAVGLWPSRGLHVHGIEAKSGRGDWLKELKNPAKQETIFQYCDRFWLYATNDRVVLDVNEIPEMWGYLLFNGRSVKVIKEAPLLKPKPLSRTFFSAVMKRATEGLVHPDCLADRMKSFEENYKLNLDREFEKTKNMLSRLRSDVAEFEKAAGVSISSERYQRYTPEQMGHAVKAVLHGSEEIQKFENRMDRIRTMLFEAHQEVESAIKKYQPEPLHE